MKSFLTAILAIVSLCNLSARVLTVSNNPVNPGQYNTFAAANTAANSGDTIYLHGSPTSYGGVYISKSITLIGVGHNPNKQNVQLSMVDNIDFISNVANVFIQGLTVNYIANYNSSSTYDRNINNFTAEYCNITVSANFQYGCTNWTFRNCYFSGTSTYNIVGQTSNARSGLLIQNCIFNNGIYQLGNVANCLVVNNDFFGTYSLTGYFDGIVFSNNMSVNPNPWATASISNSTLSNNVAYYYNVTMAAPVGTNNILQSNVINIAPSFVSFAVGGATAYSYAKNVRLNVGSAGKNAGTDGTDVGVYGGSSPFSNTGEPPLPVMRTMNITNLVTPVGTALNVNFTSSKANPR
jgi:hypothetical protein